MKKFIPIILLACALAVSGQSFVSFTYYSWLVAPDTVYTGDTLTLRLTVRDQWRTSLLDSANCWVRVRVQEIGGQATYQDIIIPGKFRHPKNRKDTINYKVIMPYFPNKCTIFARVSVFLNYVNQTVIDEYNYANYVLQRAIYLPSAPLALLDYTVDQELGEPLYYIDMNGRQLTEPKGLAVAVYSNGRRKKVLFQ